MPHFADSSSPNEYLIEVARQYREVLLQDVVPFWLRYAVDREEDGFMFCLDRDGTVIDTDKGMWQHGRFSWLLSTLYERVEPRDEWLEGARHGIDFIRRYGFDQDGRAFFKLTRDGRPLVKRRYLFTETFHATALAAYGSAASDRQAIAEAEALFKLLLRYLRTPGLTEPKVNPLVRRSKGLVVPMILIATAQVLRTAVDEPDKYDELITECIDEIQRDFMKEELKAVLETVGPAGEFIDHFDGRLITPGHSIEAGWFILEEARRRGGDARLVEIGTRIVDWMWEWGWDQEYGGIYYFRDVMGKPSTEYWHDMKFWWPHNEVIIALLLAYELTGDVSYLERHSLVHHWAFEHFADPEHGEWFGYLHRDGSVSSQLKGNIWKGPFHLPRMLLVSAESATRAVQNSLGTGK